MRRLALRAIRLYQWSMSPYLRGYCRHTPTCSNYTYQAIAKYGAVKGIWLGVRRLSRCRPLGASGYDPIP
jgi:putative membrane protein insertion efficiency factor